VPTTGGPDVERLETRVGRLEQALQLTSARAQVPPVLLLGLVVLVSEPFRPALDEDDFEAERQPALTLVGVARRGFGDDARLGGWLTVVLLVALATALVALVVALDQGRRAPYVVHAAAVLAVFALGGVLALANNPDDGSVQGLGVEPTAQLWLLVALLVWIHLPANQLRETI